MLMKWDDDSLVRARVLSREDESAAPIVRYVAAVMKRERERLAGIVKRCGVDPSVARAILDEGEDARIFRWGGLVQQQDQPITSRIKAA
jgi:hypothetical protein